MALVGELLNNYVHFITKQMQEIADALWGAENDNSEKLINLPHSISAQTYYKVKGTVASDYTDIPGYYDFQFNYGNFYFLCTSSFTYYNGNISIGPVTKMGRLNVNEWNLINPDVKDLADDILTDYIDSHNSIDIVKTSENNIIYSESFDSSIDNYTFTLDGLYENVKSKYPAYNGDLIQPGIQLRLCFFDLYEYDGSYYNDWSAVGICPPEVYYAQSKGATMITRTNNQTVIDNIINNSGSTHNYTNTYVSENGDTITTYYGDNYIITKANNDAETTYKEYYDALVDIVNQINTDTGDDITVPTYRDNKYGPEPPEPEPVTDDDYVDMGLGIETDGMAMYNMAVITRDELIQLITDFEANADTGLSFIPHVLGLYKLGIESSQLLTTKSEQIRLHKEPGGTSAFTSVENYNIVENQLTVIDCGSIKVDREELLTNTFYDYSPYSTYEMFIPGCGWITLPDTIVGRTISVAIVFDLTTCSCKGVVRTEGKLLGGSGTTIATVNGIIGSSVPLSINETGLQNAAIFNGSTQAAMALGTAFLGVGIGNPYMGASGVAMAAGALADNHVAGNTTYTNTKGGATDYSVFGDGYKAVLKITRPQVEVPDNYGHTVGFVVNEYGVLSDFHGFTVCVNPHVHISATSDEKEEIKRLLESGVILPDGESE